MSSKSFEYFFSKNLTALLAHHKMRASDLAKILGVSQSAISLYSTGERTPPIGKIIQIEQYFNLKEGSLLTLRLIDVSKSSITRSFKAIPILKTVAEVKTFLESGVIPKNIQEVNLMGFRNELGSKGYFNEFQGDYMISSENPRESIYSGDLLGVNPEVTPANGDIISFILNEEFKVGQYCSEEGSITIKSFNKNYPTIVVDDRVAIQGVVKDIYRSL
jgi:SOS-response transcriptional repressor LexA